MQWARSLERAHNLKLVIPTPEPERQNIHDNRHSVYDAHRRQFGLHWLQANDQNGKAEKVEITEKENQPDTLEG